MERCRYEFIEVFFTCSLYDGNPSVINEIILIIIYRVKYLDYDSARLRLFEYIEDWYNRKRINGSIGSISPDEYERLCRAS